jgi:hypothetical protein
MNLEPQISHNILTYQALRRSIRNRPARLVAHRGAVPSLSGINSASAAPSIRADTPIIQNPHQTNRCPPQIRGVISTPMAANVAVTDTVHITSGGLAIPGALIGEQSSAVPVVLIDVT